MSQSPFSASIRRGRLRTVLITAALVLLATGGFYAYTRVHRSTLLILEPTAGLEITLNGRAVAGKQTDRGLSIPVVAGQYRLEIKRPDYAPYSQDIRLPAGTQLTIRPVFTILPVPSGTPSDISFVRLAPEQKAVYFLSDARTRLYRLEIGNSTPLPLTDTPLRNVKDVQWTGSPDFALVVQADGSYLQEIPKYDFLRQRLVKIAGPELISPVWDPVQTERLAAAYFTERGERVLILADKRLEQIDRKVELRQFKQPRLVWSPDGRRIAVYDQAADAEETRLWVYTLADASFEPVTQPGRLVDARFNPTGSRLLIEKAAGENPLSILTLAPRSERPITIAKEARRTTWKDADTLYIPGEGQALLEYRVTDESRRPAYTFPEGLAVQGMLYFPEASRLVFYTENAVYTVDLGG